MVMRRAEANDAGAAAVAAAAGPSTSSATSRCTCARCSRTRRCGRRSLGVLDGGGLVVGVGGQRRCAVRPDDRPAWRGVHPRPRPGHAASPWSPTAETWSPERLHRTLELADTPVATLPIGHRAGARSGGRVGARRRRSRSTASCRRVELGAVADRVSALGDRHRVDGDRRRRRLTVGAPAGEREDVLDHVETLGDVAERDVGALGVERRGVRPGDEEPLRRRRCSAGPPCGPSPGRPRCR